MNLLNHATPTCLNCQSDLLDTGEVTLVDWVEAWADPEGKTRLDLILECEKCGQKFNAFVPLDEFVVLE